MTILQLYVFIRLDSVRFGERRISRKVLVVTGVVLWLLFIVGRRFGGHGPDLHRILLDLISMQWMGTVFIFSVTFLAVDLVTGFGWFVRKRKGQVRGAAFCAGFCLVLLANIQGFRAPAVQRYDVGVAELPQELDGTTIVAMADFHAGEMLIGEEWMAARVRQVMELRPDMIVLAGDLFERGCPPEAYIPVMDQLFAPLGVWAVRGNHDRLRPGRTDATGDVLTGANIPLLENRWEQVANGLMVAGVDDLTMARRRGHAGRDTLKSALDAVPDGAVVLLSHSPLLLEEAVSNGVDLMISGHTHNGQIWPFNYLVKQVYPHVAGQARIRDMVLIVNRGTGTWGPRMRLWEPGEISLITLHTD